MEKFLTKFDQLKLKLIKKGSTIKKRLFFLIVLFIVFETYYLYNLYKHAELIGKTECIAGSVFFAFMMTFGYVRIPPIKFVSPQIIRDIYIHFKLAIINTLFKQSNLEARYFINSPVEKEKFINSDLFHQKIIRYKGKDGFSGNFSGNLYQLSELHVESTKRIIFNGLFIELKNNEKQENKPNSLFLPENKITAQHKINYPVEIEHIQFDEGKTYKIISTHKNLAHSNEIVKLLAGFVEHSDKDIMISYSNSVIYIAISVNETLFELDISKNSNKLEKLSEHILLFNASINLLKNFSTLLN